jgi:type II secretory pathway component GspD/PulD (secretin)
MNSFARLAGCLTLANASWLILLPAALSVVTFAQPRSAAAADPTFVGILALAADPLVAKDLGLSDDVVKQLNDLIAQREEDVQSLVLEIKDLPPADRDPKLASYVAESEKLGLALLTAEQQTKLKQARVRKLGMKGLLDKSIAEQVGLTDSQRGKIDVMHQLFANKTATLPQAEVDAARIELEKGILALLDNDQRVKWEGMTGRVVDLTQAGPAPGAGPPGGPPSRGGFGREGLSRDGMSRSGTPAAGSTNASVGLKAENGEVKLKFQFRYTPWKEVIDWFAQQSDFSLVTENYPTGTFNYSDSRAYTPAQSLDLLNSVLLTKGYRLVRKERMLFLLSAEDQLPDTFVSRVDESELDKKGEFEIVQCMFQLNKITAEEAEAEIRKLVSPQGKVVVLPKARQLVVTETVGTLRQIRKNIQAIENPAIPKDETTVVVRLETLRPSEFMAQARTSLNIPENQYATADGSLRISVDELGMRLLVTGKPERIAKVEEIRKLIDSDSGSLVEGSGAPLEQPQLVIYSVQKADPAAVLQILQTLLAGEPDVRLTVDPKTGNLVALCRPSQHATIRATLDEMQRDATQVEVIKLRRIDPQAAVLQINKLFGGGDQPAPNAPKVEADTTNMQLLIRANAPQVAQIRELLQKMGEVGEDSPLTQAERTTMRMIPLTGTSARKAVEQLESLWPVVHKNKIRVVTPANRTPRGSGQFDQPPTEGPNSSDALEQLEKETEKYRPSSSRAVPAPAGQVPVSDRTTKSSARGQTQAYFVSQPLPAVETKQPEAAPAEANQPETTQPEAAPTTTTQPGDNVAEKPAEEAPAGPVSKPGAEVVITVTPNGIFIVSEDLDALDKMEEMLRQVADNQVSGSKELAIYYLKYAKAQVAATLLQEMLSGAPAPSDGGGGSLMGDIAANMMGDMGGGGLLGGLLGMGGGGSSGAVVSAGSATITPDIRLNSLMVQATPRDHERIEEILQFIDKPAGPEAVQTAAAPRFIPVYNSTADSIATVVRQVYAGRMAADASGGGQQRQPSPEDFIRALRGGRGGRGGGNDQAARGEETKMTVGVDTRTNSLIVSAPDYLFEEVKALVAQLDTAELASDETVRVVSLRAANADVITRSLAQVYGESITSSKTSTSDTGSSSRPSSSRSSSNSSRSSSNSSRGGSSSQGRSPQASGGDFRQQMQMIQALQGGGGRGGGGRGGFGGGGGRGGR